MMDSTGFYGSGSSVSSYPTIYLGSLVPEHEGYLTKQGGNIKSWKKRWFVLQARTLYYFPTCNSDAEPLGVINLSAATTVVSVADVPKKEYGFQVVTPDRTYTIVASTEQEREAWTSIIQKTLNGINGSALKRSKT
eukprot:TRINITY_DN1454_c0_g1_i2.p1 TRINITY_DN1454_c0_g1~~TRINITY_DN1454_c0_g1_i2.p1  ORF type:complete len:136 (+),score=20.93 TRINITY_DN1454_c0_g1_i2:43-450(+)